MSYSTLTIFGQDRRRLEDQGILVPVTFSDWLVPMIVVRKLNGNMCLCADSSTGQNAALDGDCYLLQISEDIFIDLNGGNCSARMDLVET